MKERIAISILFVLMSLFSLACSRDYEPVSSLEQAEFEKAKRDVYPDDVRDDLLRYQSSLLVWPGIILESDFQENADGIEIIFLLEHHYYDWILDYGAQRERIFLSPRGEGLFKTSWFLKDDSNLSEIKQYAAVGNLAIVYGIPQRVENDIVTVRSSYIRAFDKQSYRTDKLDYGRE